MRDEGLVTRKFIVFQVGTDGFRSAFCVLAGVVPVVFVGVEHLDWLELYDVAIIIRGVAVSESVTIRRLVVSQQIFTFLKAKFFGPSLSFSRLAYALHDSFNYLFPKSI